MSSHESTEAAEEGGVVQMVELQDEAQIARLVALLFPRLHLSPSAAASSSSELLLSFLTSFLSTTPQLRALFGLLGLLQQRLDGLDIEGLYPLYARAIAAHPENLSEHKLWQGIHPNETSPPEYQEATTNAASAPPQWLASLLHSIAPIPSGDAAYRSTPPQQSLESHAAVNSSSSTIFEFPPRTPFVEPLDQTPVCKLWSGDTLAAPPRPSSLATVSPLVGCCSSNSSTSADGAFSSDGAASTSSSLDAEPSLVLQHVRAFLLATTLKDVSVMCTMLNHNEADDHDNDEKPLATSAATASPASSSSSSSASSQLADEVPRARVSYSVRLIDLECKAVAKMHEYHRLDRSIVQLYLQQIQTMHRQNEAKPCDSN